MAHTGPIIIVKKKVAHAGHPPRRLARPGGAPAQYTVVCGAAPCSPGKSSTRHFNILGFLPSPDNGASDITDLYVARYGPIPADSRIFIRTYQHIDGWEDLPKQTSAIVPKA